MSGVGFTVFQVPGAKTAKRPTAARLNSGGLGGGPAITSSLLHSVGTPSPHVGSQSGSSSSQQRGQRNSSSTFAAFQPPGGLQPLATSTHPSAVPYSGTSGSLGSHSVSSTGSGSGHLAVPMGVGIGFQNPSGAAVQEEEQRRGGVGWMRTGRVIRVKDSGDSFRFPLDPAHLPSIHVSPPQFEALKDKLHALAEAHVTSSATWLENPSAGPQYRNQSWKPHLEKKNCVIYRQKEAADASNLQRKALVRAKLDTSLEELQYAVQCETTEDQRAYMAHCYQESFLDAAVLQVHERATRADPFRFLGVKWLAFQSSVDSVFSCRDSLIVEYSKTFEDASGHKVLARVAQSLELADYDGHERNFGFARTTGTWVWLFRSLGPASGKVDVAALTDDRFDGARPTPSWFANRVVSTLYTVAIHHATSADAKFLVRGRRISDKAWVPNSERPACSVCFKSFNLLRSRHHCRVCAEIMCGACTIELGVQASQLPPGMLPETGSSFIVSVEKFCLKCINKARQERRSALAAAAIAVNLDDDGQADEDLDAPVPDSYATRPSEVFYGQVPPARGSLGSDHMANAMDPPQSHSFASSSSSTSSLGGVSAGGEKTGISYAGWSTKVLSAINREKPADGDQPLQVALSSNGSSGNMTANGVLRNGRQTAGDRRRHNSDASGGSTSMSSQSDRGSNSVTDGGRRERDPLTGEAVMLLEEGDEVENITPLPTSFTKMEEQIAAQQALLR
ncbi:hypothetical protein BBJ28_00010951, partial [Nothophytophthora sp. Chile5]